MTEFKKTSGWSKGANNLAQNKRVPEGFVRHALNVDATPDGILTSRVGYERLYAGTNVRGVLALGTKLPYCLSKSSPLPCSNFTFSQVCS